MTLDPQKIRPMRDWCVVLEDKQGERIGSGVLIRAGDYQEEKLAEGTGTLIKVGSSKKTVKLGLEVGQRVVFRGYLKHANPIETDELWDLEKGEKIPAKKKYFLMSCDDLVGLIPPGMSVGVFNSPASHAIPAGAFDDPKKGK